jgi:hypothetical protein
MEPPEEKLKTKQTLRASKMTLDLAFQWAYSLPFAIP